MGTNFYFITKQQPDNVRTQEYHIGKRSYGWLPHFQTIHIWSGDFDWLNEDVDIESVRQLREFYFKYKDYLYIADEEGTPFSWKQFEDEFINWKGGNCPNPPKHHIHLSPWTGEEIRDKDGYEWTTYDFF